MPLSLIVHTYLIYLCPRNQSRVMGVDDGISQNSALSNPELTLPSHSTNQGKQKPLGRMHADRFCYFKTQVFNG